MARACPVFAARRMLARPPCACGPPARARAGASRAAPSTSAAETIVEYVRDLLERGELRPGDRLPPERALALQTGVSRSSVRVGLRALVDDGHHPLAPRVGHVRRRRPADPRVRAAALPGGAARLHAGRDVRGTAPDRGRGRRAERDTRDGRADRGDRRGSDEHVRVPRQPAGLPAPRHPLPPGRGGLVRQPDPRRRWSRCCRRCSTSGGARR